MRKSVKMLFLQIVNYDQMQKKKKIKKWQNAKQQNEIETKYITIRYKYGNTQKAIYKFNQPGHS